MRIALLMILVLVVSLVKAQQVPLYSQYVINSFIINPAIAGTSLYSPIRLTARQQWAGITDAPSTQVVSGYATLTRSKNMGVGGFIYNDSYGPFGNFGIQGAYAYQLPFGFGPKLSLGLSLSVSQIKLDESELLLVEADDDVTGAVEKKIKPDAGFGAYLYDRDYFVGLSVTQLFQTSVNYNDLSSLNNKLIRHYFLLAGYRYSITTDYQLEPSILFKSTFQAPSQLDINVKAYYKRMYWVGVAYRSDKSFIATMGANIDKYYIAYAFDCYFSSLNNYTYGSHEVVLGINLGNAKGSTLF